MEPVRVPGSATIAVAGALTKYLPDTTEVHCAVYDFKGRHECQM